MEYTHMLPGWYAIRTKQGRTIANAYVNLLGQNIITTDPRYANDHPRINKIIRELFSNNKLAVVIRCGRVANCKRNHHPQPPAHNYVYRLNGD